MRSFFSFFALFVLIIHQSTIAQHDHNCGQHIVLKNMLKDSSYKSQFEKEQYLLSINKKFSKSLKGTVYKIPVAFHIVHNNGVEKIDRAQVLDALAILNRDLRALRPDTATVDSIFKPLIADIEVEFELATKAPDGACFSGITYTESEYSYNNGDINGSDQLDDVINNNDVYQGIWPGNQYLNVLICGAVGAGVAGYAYYPTGTGDSMNWGIWLRHDYCGSIGTGSPSASKTFVHEVGHWLNLPHTWGSTNEPSLLDNCDTDDGVEDTPNTIGSTWCNYNETTCGSHSNIENHMEYSSCRKMFTLGQKERMRAALTSSVGGRSNLITSTNHQLTGINIEPPFCRTDFFAENYITCSGDSLFFQDESYHNPIAWNWDFEGATPNFSLQKDAYAYYTSPGLFDVSLTATGDSLNYLTETKNDRVVVMDYNGFQLPYIEGFENSSLSNPEWVLTGGSWEITDIASYSGNYSLKVNNLGSTEGTKHVLESKTFDLSDSTSAFFSFKYAFANRNNDNNDKLKILASKDCGKTWSLRKLIQFSQLTTAANQTNFTPSNDEWKQAVVSSIIGPYCVKNFRFKFEFITGGGNDLFIDDINISIDNTINFQDKENNELIIYPNPSSKELSIISSIRIKKIKIFDITGKLILEKKDSKTEIKLDIHRLNKGFYTMLIETELTTLKRIFLKN